MKQRGLYIFLAFIYALSLIAITYSLVFVSSMFFDTTFSLGEFVFNTLQIGAVIFIAFFLPLLFVILVRWRLQRFPLIAFLISGLIIVGYGYSFLDGFLSVYSGEKEGRLWFFIFINTTTLLLIGEFFIWKFHDGKVVQCHLNKMDYLKVLLICIWVVYQGIFVQEGFVTQEKLAIKHILELLPFMPVAFLLSLNIVTSLNRHDKERIMRSNLLIISIGVIFFWTMFESGDLRYLDGKLLFLIWMIISMTACLQLLLMICVLDKSTEYRPYFFSVLCSFVFISLILTFNYTENVSEALMLFIKSFADFMPCLTLMMYLNHLCQGKPLKRILLDILLGMGYFVFIRNLSDFSVISSFDWKEFLLLLLSFSLLKESFIFLLSLRRLTASR